MENELRNFVNLNYGPNAWNEVIRIQVNIRKKKKEAIEEAKRKQAQMIENLIIGVLLLLFPSHDRLEFRKEFKCLTHSNYQKVLSSPTH